MYSGKIIFWNVKVILGLYIDEESNDDPRIDLSSDLQDYLKVKFYLLHNNPILLILSSKCDKKIPTKIVLKAYPIA